MKMSKIVAEIEGWYLPAELRGREIIKGKDLKVGDIIENDSPVIVRRTAKHDEKTNDVKMSQAGNVIFDWLAFIPIRDGRVIVTKSPPIVKIARTICTEEMPSEEGQFATMLKASELIEGRLKVATEKFDYGSKGQQDVITLIDAEAQA